MSTSSCPIRSDSSSFAHFFRVSSSSSCSFCPPPLLRVAALLLFFLLLLCRLLRLCQLHIGRHQKTTQSRLREDSEASRAKLQNLRTRHCRAAVESPNCLSQALYYRSKWSFGQLLVPAAAAMKIYYCCGLLSYYLHGCLVLLKSRAAGALSISGSLCC